MYILISIYFWLYNCVGIPKDHPKTTPGTTLGPLRDHSGTNKGLLRDHPMTTHGPFKDHSRTM